MPTSAARYQSAGEVHVAMRSPNPARVITGGAPVMVGTSIRRASGHFEILVRFTPLFSSTDMLIAKALTEAAVCTTTSGTSPLRAAASLQRSVMVPEPTATTQSEPSTAVSTSAR